LPIVGRFQDKARDGKRIHEPEPYELQWSAGAGVSDAAPVDRLASPLIVKAMPLPRGMFVPCALWLHRAYPESGSVVLVRHAASRAAGSGSQKQVVKGSAAPFDRLVAPGDDPLFLPLRGKASLREAFLAWLRQTQKSIEVAP
jgi:CRISPR-associated protein Cmr1